MAIYTIGIPDGRKLRIEAADEATALRGAQEWAAANPKLDPGNVSDPSPEFQSAMEDASARSTALGRPTTGLWENIGAGIDQGANAILGAPVDLPVYLGNSLLNAGNSALEMAGAGRPLPNIPTDLPGSSQAWERTQENLGFTPPSKVVPADDGQRLARAAAESTTMAALPEAAMIRAGQVASKLPAAVQSGTDALAALLGQSRTAGQFARNMATNAAAGAGSQAAMDAAPEGWEPIAGLAGGLGAGIATHGATALPGVVKAGANVAGDYLAPLTQGGRERMAGETIRDAATDIGAVREALDAPTQNVPGSDLTTFQQTGDMGLGALERGAAAKSPAEFNQRRADQNAAQIAAMDSVQSTGAPENVAAALRAQLEDIDARTAARLDQTTANARQSAAAIGQGKTPEVSGENIRASIESARSAAKEREDAIWSLVDPDGTLALSPTKTRAAGKQIVEETPASARQPNGEEAAIYDLVKKYGDTISLRELSALHTRVKDELRQLRTMGMGDSAPYRRLTELNNSVFADLNEAVVAKVAQEERAVAAGTMNEMDTIAANIMRQVEEFHAARQTQARSIGGEGNGGSRGSGSAGLSRPYGAEVPGGRRSGNAESDPRLSGNGLVPNFDNEALDRLTLARETTQKRVNTFDNPTLKPIRQRPSTQSPYDMQAASVPGRIFHAGAKSFDDVQTYRRAVGDRVAMPQLQAYAADRIRAAALREDGTIDPGRLASWRRSHADALRAFPALDRKLADAAKASEAMAEVATTRKLALEDAQKGVLGRIMGLDDPQDVVKTIGGIFSRQDSAAQMQRLVAAIGDDPEAREGLRKSIVDYVAGRFIGNTEAATSGLGTIKSDGYQTFFRQNTNALRMAGFNSDELDMMARIAKDLQQTNRSIASVKLPGGSNTAQDTFAIRQTDAPQTILAKLVATTAATGTGATLAFGPVVGLPVAAGTAIVGAFRQAGIQKVDDLVKDAMLNPARARLLLQKATPANIKLAGTTLPQMLRRSALVSGAAVNQDRDRDRQAP